MILAFKNVALAPTLNNRAIRYWTDSDWVHCEMLLTYPRRLAVAARPQGGLMPRLWTEVIDDPDGWEFYWIDLKSETGVWEFLSAEMGKSYNWFGLLAGHVATMSHQQPDSWFCSELVYATLSQYSLLDLPLRDPTQISPNDLRNYVLVNNCKQVFINEQLTQ